MMQMLLILRSAINVLKWVMQINIHISQGWILTFKATCPVGQVRLKIHLSCMKWHL